MPGMGGSMVRVLGKSDAFLASRAIQWLTTSENTKQKLGVRTVVQAVAPHGGCEQRSKIRARSPCNYR